jgi:glycosyltransferase involved in cell wall biosynthesis
MHPLLQKLTIAVPVYNDVKYIRTTLESCVNEAGTILICDNGSTDGTSEICAEFAQTYPHVTHIRHAENLGAFENFKYPLFHCTTDYFGWLGSHDLLGSGYALPLLTALESDKGIALMTGTIQYIGEQGELWKKVFRSTWLNALQNATPLERLNAFATSLRDCSLVYGVFRTTAARAAWFDTASLGFDRSLLFRTAALGKVVYEPQSTLYARGFNVSRNSKEDQHRRVGDLSGVSKKPIAKNLFIRNKSMVETVLAAAKTPEDLTFALRIVDKLNRRHQNRRYYQKLRLLKIIGIIVLIAVFALLFLRC